MQEDFFEKNIAWANQLSNYNLYDFCCGIEDANENLADKITYTGSNIINYFSF